jgi:hypothetical protein
MALNTMFNGINASAMPLQSAMALGMHLYCMQWHCNANFIAHYTHNYHGIGATRNTYGAELAKLAKLNHYDDY